jgi:hypothetical protein
MSNPPAPEVRGRVLCDQGALRPDDAYGDGAVVHSSGQRTIILRMPTPTPGTLEAIGLTCWEELNDLEPRDVCASGE